MQTVEVASSNGPVQVTLLGEIEVNGKKFVIIKNSVGGFVNGIHAPFLLVHPHLITRQIENIRVDE